MANTAMAVGQALRDSADETIMRGDVLKAHMDNQDDNSNAIVVVSRDL